MKKPIFRNLTLSAMFFAIGIILPFFTGQIPQIGSMLLPMHIPVFLTALICGWQYGSVVGFFLPIIRSLLFTMPPIFPDAASMAFELATYGLLTGLIYRLIKHRSILTVYISLIVSMIGGRAVWGLVQLVLLSFTNDTFTFGIFFARAFSNAIPGIIVQFIVIPMIMAVLDKLDIISFKDKRI